MSRKSIYLLFSVIGFIVPNIFVAKESIETGNYLLWVDPAATFYKMFANSVSSAFAVDLLIVVLVFFFWSYYESKKYGIKKIWQIWILTMAFGLSGTLPLFLYLREKKIEINR